MGFFSAKRSEPTRSSRVPKLTDSGSTLILIVSFLLASCAGEKAPEGGPVDVDPPFVASTIPPNYTTRFSGSTITIEFNKYVDHRSVEGAIFISPSLGQLQFDWSGREVAIRFSEKLRRSTTYVVTVGTDVADTHNRNKMANSYTLAFSTGGDIDHGAIEGKVFPRKDLDSPLGVMIFAYKLDGLNPDTLDPRTTRPDYVTQTGKKGEFLLQHLSFGPYRVFAVRDEYRNLLYDPEVDEFGVPSTPIRLTPADTLKALVWMKLEKEDTSAVRLLKASPTNQRHLVVEFSSPIDTSVVKKEWFHITDTLGKKQLQVDAVCPVFPKLTSALVVTDTQDPKESYRLQIDSLRGANGLGLNVMANRLTFPGSEVKDTLGPIISSFSIRDSTREVDLAPSFVLHFSDAVRRNNVEGSISVVDSSRNAVPISLRWLSDASLTITTNGRILSNAWYAIRVGMRSVMNLVGKRGRDSLKVYRFQTVDEESFSNIEGVVSDQDTTDLKGQIFLVARNVAKEPRDFSMLVGAGGPFLLGDIPEGKYILMSYRDRNGNLKYDPGRVFPYMPSERFTQYPDTLKLRARWPLEGVELKLR